MRHTTKTEDRSPLTQRIDQSYQITPPPRKLLGYSGYTTTDFALASQHLSEMASVTKTAGVFAQACERSGGTVVLNPDFGCLPMIIGRNREMVLMYKFVEVLHELTSLADIQRELPSLSYRQIEGGITFLRSLTQFNMRGVDIDAEEEQLLEASPKFQQQIKDALKMEQTRVFTFEQQTV